MKRLDEYNISQMDAKYAINKVQGDFNLLLIKTFNRKGIKIENTKSLSLWGFDYYTGEGEQTEGVRFDYDFDKVTVKYRDGKFTVSANNKTAIQLAREIAIKFKAEIKKPAPAGIFDEFVANSPLRIDMNNSGGTRGYGNLEIILSDKEEDDEGKALDIFIDWVYERLSSDKVIRDAFRKRSKIKTGNPRSYDNWFETRKSEIRHPDTREILAWHQHYEKLKTTFAMLNKTLKTNDMKVKNVNLGGYKDITITIYFDVIGRSENDISGRAKGSSKDNSINLLKLLREKRSNSFKEIEQYTMKEINKDLLYAPYEILDFLFENGYERWY